MKRNENGYGSVVKLSGNRRKPYAAKVSEMVTEGVIADPSEQKRIEKMVNEVSTDTIWEVIKALHPDDAEEWISTLLKEEFKKQCFKGKQKFKYIGYYATKKEAQIALAEWNKYGFKADSLEYTFKDVWEALLPTLRLEECSESKQKAYMTGFDKCEKIHGSLISKLKLADIQAVLDSYSDKSASTINQIKVVIKAVFDYASKHDLIVKNYADYLQMPSHKEAEGRKSFDRATIKELWHDDTFEAKMTLILCYTGCRINELLSVKKEDVKDGVMWVNGTKNSTSKRFVPIHPDIEGLVEEIVPFNINYGQASYMFKNKFPDYTLHCTRHTFSTFSLSMNPVLRDYITGHKSSGITNDVYTHPEVLIPELKEEILKLSF